MPVAPASDRYWRVEGGTDPGGDADERSRRRRGRRRVYLVVVLVGLIVFLVDSGNALIAPTVVRFRLADPDVFGHGVYAFSDTSRGQPVTFSSCRSVRVVVNDELRPRGGEGVVEQAVAAASAASGLAMTIVGSTDELPSSDRALEQSRYGQGWAPVLISWSSPDVTPALAGSRIGQGGPRGFTPSTGPVFVTGQVSLDTPQLEELLDHGRVDEVRAVVMHELGHVLGLAHVDSPFELMSSESHGLTEYGPGDLAGLARLGEGPCV